MVTGRRRREIILQEANPMSGVFQNIDPPPPHRPASVYPPAFGAGGGHTRWVERGWRVNILEDTIHSAVLYICKFFVVTGHCTSIGQFDSHLERLPDFHGLDGALQHVVRLGVPSLHNTKKHLL
jgi:hypothetical protein